MNSKHTPGPWQVKEGYEKDSGLRLHLVVFGTSIVAECYGINSNANARLIAVAPELLEMLQKAVKFGGLFPDLVEEAQTIIAKATGDQS